MVQMCWVPMAKEILRDNSAGRDLYRPADGRRKSACQNQHGAGMLCLGAETVDYEPNMGFYRSGMYDEFREEGAALVRAADGKEIKAMLEFGYLYGEAEKRHAVQVADRG